MGYMLISSHETGHVIVANVINPITIKTRVARPLRLYKHIAEEATDSQRPWPSLPTGRLQSTAIGSDSRTTENNSNQRTESNRKKQLLSIDLAECIP